jgi:hypothetical protein
MVMAKIRKEHLYCLDTEESKKLMLIAKSYDKNIEWSKGNNANYISANFTPFDANDDLRGTLPGVSVQLDYKKPIKIKSSEKTVITLFKLKKGIKYRAYQVEACDENKASSHDGANTIYGCHEHIGKCVLKINALHETMDISSWFGLFCGKVNLNFTGELESI